MRMCTVGNSVFHSSIYTSIWDFFESAQNPKPKLKPNPNAAADVMSIPRVGEFQHVDLDPVLGLDHSPTSNDRKQHCEELSWSYEQRRAKKA